MKRSPESFADYDAFYSFAVSICHIPFLYATHQYHNLLLVSLSVPVSLLGTRCAALARIAPLCGRMGLEVRGALFTGAEADCFTLQLAEYTSVSGSQERVDM